MLEMPSAILVSMQRLDPNGVLHKEQLKGKLTDLSRNVFVCSNDSAADGSVENSSKIAGGNMTEPLGGRYIAENSRD